jgi:hypothetical protein
MLKIEKLQEALEATRGRGNTTHLLKSVQGTNVDLLVDTECTREILGHTNVVSFKSYSPDRAFVLDNNVIQDAINEALELIARLRK